MYVCMYVLNWESGIPGIDSRESGIPKSDSYPYQDPLLTLTLTISTRSRSNLFSSILTTHGILYVQQTCKMLQADTSDRSLISPASVAPSSLNYGSTTLHPNHHMISGRSIIACFYAVILVTTSLSSPDYRILTSRVNSGLGLTVCGPPHGCYSSALSFLETQDVWDVAGPPISARHSRGHKCLRS